MSAALHTLPRPAAGGRPPLVPAAVVLKDPPYLRFDPDLLDSRWYRSCSPVEALAGIALRARALKQPDHAGSLPDDDAELAYLADFGRDIDGWRAAKAKALEGWSLCSDGRWHHPEIARNVLHIWIGRQESRRISAWGNASKDPDGNDYGLGSIQSDIDDALAALRTIDPQDAVLREATGRAAKWRIRIANHAAPPPEAEVIDLAGSEAEPNRQPNRPPNRLPSGGGPKGSEAKGSESISLSQSESGAQEEEDHRFDPEFGQGRGEPPHPVDEGPPQPSGEAYPPDAFDRWWEAWPNKIGLGAAKKAFDKIRRSGTVGFATLMVAVDRYRRCKPVDRPWCNPATWLNQTRWFDEWPDPGSGGPSPPSGGRPMTGRASALAGLRRRFDDGRPGPGGAP